MAAINIISAPIETAVSQSIEARINEGLANVEIQIDESEAIMLARLVWGEARGCSVTEQAAVIWCVLNRVDAGQGNIRQVVTAPSQFTGYSSSNPVEDDMLNLAKDVLTRWYREKGGATDVGRVLAAEYLFFSGDGQHNYFRTEYKGGSRWDWSLPSPYGE